MREWQIRRICVEQARSGRMEVQNEFEVHSRVEFEVHSRVEYIYRELNGPYGFSYGKVSF